MTTTAQTRVVKITKNNEAVLSVWWAPTLKRGMRAATERAKFLSSTDLKAVYATEFRDVMGAWCGRITYIDGGRT